MTAALQSIQSTEKVRQQRQELLVQHVVGSTSDGPEESAQQKEVVERLFRSHRQLHRAQHDLLQVRTNHRLVLNVEHADAAEDELEELQEQIRLFDVGGSDFFHPIQQILDHDRREQRGGGAVRQERVDDHLQVLILDHLLNQKADGRREDLLEVLTRHVEEEPAEQLQQLLLLPLDRWVHSHLPVHAQHGCVDAVEVKRLDGPVEEVDEVLNLLRRQHESNRLRQMSAVQEVDAERDGFDAAYQRLNQQSVLGHVEVRRGSEADARELRDGFGQDVDGEKFLLRRRTFRLRAGGCALMDFPLLDDDRHLNLRDGVELQDEDFQHADEQLPAVAWRAGRSHVAPLHSDAIDEVQEEPDAHDLDGGRQRLVVNVLREQMNGFDENLELQLLTDVMDEVAERGVSQRTQRFMRRVAASQQQILIEQQLDRRHEMSPQIRRQNVSRRD